ncbi:alpha/beta hydrolase family protein [Pikeienuella piscinae]|nr:dienelactone hydrolase [Pikeienuella piscinae]
MAENRIDVQRPDAPDLAAYGAAPVGVRTIELVNNDQIDIVAIDPKAPKPDPLPRYDRALTVEVWYPAAEGVTGETAFPAMIRDGKTIVTLHGRAMRDVAPGEGKWPLVIVSHGYPGNRYLLSHLAENIASKGYVVASIDHRDSTYDDKTAFGSTLVNRPLDQIFVLSEMARLGGDGESFLNGIVDSENSALIGYSMGGYGAVIAAGGGVTQASVDYPWGGPHGTLGIHLSGSPTHDALPDPRFKTAIAFAPWGVTRGFWDAETLKGVRIPMLFIAGSVDDVAGYDPGVRTIWEGATNVDRALLTFVNANHNAAAPYPAPEEGREIDPDLGFAPFDHYADAVWDTVRMNNIAQHFVTAWLDSHVKDDKEAASYLELIPDADDGVWALNEDGTPKPEHTYWRGFQERTAKGLRYEVLNKGQ